MTRTPLWMRRSIPEAAHQASRAGQIHICRLWKMAHRGYGPKPRPALLVTPQTRDDQPGWVVVPFTTTPIYSGSGQPRPAVDCWAEVGLLQPSWLVPPTWAADPDTHGPYIGQANSQLVDLAANHTSLTADQLALLRQTVDR